MSSVNNKKFGLVGKNISYSFSKGYFKKKFSNLELEGYSYENFDLQRIDGFPEILTSNPELGGLNVTIPYKQEIIPYLDALDAQAEQIGAVNTIRFENGKLTGHNTDAYGFRKSIEPFLKSHHKKALILGTGGASKAIAYVFGQLGIGVTYVSRNPTSYQIRYTDLDRAVMTGHSVVANCTPLGTHPDIGQRPNIPYEYLDKKHLLFDLIYNPEKTAFLKAGEQQGATISNGLRMLELQAERSWQIWNGQI